MRVDRFLCKARARAGLGKPQLACRVSWVYGFRSCLRVCHEGIAVRYGFKRPLASYNPVRVKVVVASVTNLAGEYAGDPPPQ
jgi:hypothetical protein